MRSKLSADQWARIRAYCVERTREELKADTDLARRLSDVADGFPGEAPFKKGRQALADELAAEAVKWGIPPEPGHEGPDL